MFMGCSDIRVVLVLMKTGSWRLEAGGWRLEEKHKAELFTILQPPAFSFYPPASSLQPIHLVLF
jgi:hypothetical protein